MDRRVPAGNLGLVSEPARAPPGLLAQHPNLFGLGGGDLRRRVPWAAGTLDQARQRRALTLARRAPALDPGPDRRGRDVRPGGRLGERLSVLDDTTRDLPASPRGEARSMVRHPGLLEGVSFDTHTLSAGPDLTPHHVLNVPGRVI